MQTISQLQTAARDECIQDISASSANKLGYSQFFQWILSITKRDGDKRSSHPTATKYIQQVLSQDYNLYDSVTNLSKLMKETYGQPNRVLASISIYEDTADNRVRSFV